MENNKKTFLGNQPVFSIADYMEFHKAKREHERQTNDAFIESVIVKYDDAILKRQEWVYKIDSMLLLINVTLFSIVISLHMPSAGSFYNLWLLRAAICLNLLCIILLAVALYSHIHNSNLYVRKTVEVLRSHGQGLKKVGKTYFSDSPLKTPMFFLYCRKSSYILFLILTTLYALYALTK